MISKIDLTALAGRIVDNGSYEKGLLVVESPTKARTIGKYLADSFEVVMATVGHFRDWCKSTMGVELKDGWEIWVCVGSKKLFFPNYYRWRKKPTKYLLASDPDREGEAIAYHTKFLISDDKFLMKKKLEIRGFPFMKLRKEAVEEALKGRPGKLIEFG